MKACVLTIAVGIWMFTTPAGAKNDASGLDQRLRNLQYDPGAVVTVPVKRGVVTLVVLDADESIAEVASGLGSDCSKAEASWCVAAQPGGRTIYVKPKSAAGAANNLAVVTDRRTHSFRFEVLADDDARQPVYRLAVKAQSATVARAGALLQGEPLVALPALRPQVPPTQVVAERLQAKPRVVNARYSLAAGKNSDSIVPTLIFDDGRFTYMRFPGNRDVPAVFQALPDDSETVVNARMEDDLLVVDRVSKKLVLRAGTAVVGVWNEDFDAEGLAPVGGTTVPGVRRAGPSDISGSQAPALKGATK